MSSGTSVDCFYLNHPEVTSLPAPASVGLCWLSAHHTKHTHFIVPHTHWQSSAHYFLCQTVSTEALPQTRQQTLTNVRHYKVKGSMFILTSFPAEREREREPVKCHIMIQIPELDVIFCSVFFWALQTVNIYITVLVVYNQIIFFMHLRAKGKLNYSGPMSVIFTIKPSLNVWNQTAALILITVIYHN